LIRIEQYGLGSFIKGQPTEEEIQAAQKGLQDVREAMLSGEYDVIIVEEGNVAVSCGLFEVQKLLELISQKPDNLELVITGRGAAPEVIEQADLVTEMKEIKHYYQEGVAARVGIEK